MLGSRKGPVGLIYVIFAIALSGLVGCSDFYPIEEQSPVKDEFIALIEDDRVLYKEGMKEQALLIQRVLDEQVKIIEKIHGKPFINTPFVHLCDTRECLPNIQGLMLVFWLQSPRTVYF